MKKDATQEPQSDEDKARQALVSKWSSLIEDRVKDHDKNRSKNIDAWRKYISGEAKEDRTASDVINLIYSVFATLVPQIYAKDPDITVSPTEAVPHANYEAWRKFCNTLEIVLRRLLVMEGELKKRSKSAVRGTMTAAVGWVKVIYQRDYDEDPIIKNRLEDTQENLRRIERLIDELEDDTKAAEYECVRAELEQAVTSLRSQVEVVASEGIVIDRPLTEDIIILDSSITDFEDYPKAKAIAQRVWFDFDDYVETFGREPAQEAWRYSRDKKQSNVEDRGAGPDKKDCLYPVFEVWSKKDNTIYWVTPGDNDWLRDPFVPKRQGQRWYPFFGLAFNPVDGSPVPLSDVYLMKPLQDEYNDTRNAQRVVREDNRPATAYRRGGGIDDEDLDNIQNRQRGDMIGVGGDPDRPLSADLMSIPENQYDPRMYDTSAILMDIEQLAGASDASRNITHNAKTATEAEIMANSMQSRLGERRDALEDFITEIANYGAEVLLQELTLEQVQAIAGAEALWPVGMSKDDVFQLFRVEVRGGSTAKPNKMREQEQWIQLMPVIENTVTKYVELMSVGHPAAKILEFVLEQTLQRFDERFDLSELLPQLDPAAGGMMPGAPGMPAVPGLPPTQPNPTEQQNV